MKFTLSVKLALIQSLVQSRAKATVTNSVFLHSLKHSGLLFWLGGTSTERHNFFVVL